MLSKINISAFPKHIFWNYKDHAELSEDIVISNVILYGELSDYKTLLTLVSRQSFENVVRDIEKTGKYKKRINFIKKIIL
ncbi:MAG: hypothetical protein SGI89_15020 [bacterium]|nr:hypothetical protein [bacterium]